MRWRLEFYSERRQVLAHCRVEAPTPATALVPEDGAVRREVQKAVFVICGHEGFEVTPGKCCGCRQEQMVVRALAADTHS